MQLSAVFTKFVQKWAHNKKNEARVFKLNFGPDGDCQAAVEVFASTEDSNKYRMLLVMPVIGEVEEDLYGVCLKLDGIELLNAVKEAEVDEDSVMLEAAIDASEDDTVSISFAGGDVVDGEILSEGFDVVLPDYNEEYDVRYDEKRKVFSFDQQGMLVVCNTLDDFSVKELMEIKAKFDKGVKDQIPEDNSEKYCKDKKALKNKKSDKRRARAAKAANNFKDGVSILGDDDDADIDDIKDNSTDDAEEKNEGEDSAEVVVNEKADDISNSDDVEADLDAADIGADDDDDDADADNDMDEKTDNKAKSNDTQSEKKKKRGKRRTKEEKLEDDIAAAKKLLVEQGYAIEDSDVPKNLNDVLTTVTQKMWEATQLITVARENNLVEDKTPEPAELTKEELCKLIKPFVASGEVAVKDLL